MLETSKKREKERGAIVVEATISLSMFIFMIYTLLSVVSICFIQAKMSTSLDAAAKEISQYTYLLYETGIMDYQDELTGKGAENGKSVAEGLSSLVGALSDGTEHIQSGDFSGLASDIESGVTTVNDLAEKFGDQIKDPKTLIMGLASMAGSEALEYGKSALGSLLARCLMEKNLAESPGEDPNEFLERYHVVNGLDGLDFQGTSLMNPANEDEIQLVVTYKVKVVQLLNIDVDFTFTQCAKTKAWGSGISLDPERNKPKEEEEEESLWDIKSTTLRGQQIVAKERAKRKFPYVGEGFDGYDAAKNQLTTIISLNTFEKSYQTVSLIKSKIKSFYDVLKDDIPESIEVQDASGNVKTLSAPKGTRKYQIIVIIPENANREYLDKAIAQLKNERKDLDIIVEQGYGEYHAPEEPDNQNQTEGEK